MAQATADVVALQLEAVKTALPVLYEYNDTFLAQIQTRQDVVKVSSRAVRLPIQDQPGSRFGAVTLSGGVLGRGTATHYDVPQVTTLASRIAVEINEDVLMQTDGEPQAIRKILSLEVTNAMKEFNRQMNASLQTAGNGVLATITGVNSPAAGQLTVKVSPFYAQLCRAGQIFQVYDSTITTNRGQILVDTVDEPNGVLTIDPTLPIPAGTSVNDVLLPEALSGAQPVWYNGIPYLLSDSQTGTWLTMNRATQPAIRASAYHSGQNRLTTYPIRIALTKVLQRVGMVNPAALRVHTHPAQIDAYEQLAILISSVEKGPSAGENVDLLFTQKQMAGVKLGPDIHADRTRIDFLNLEFWGRVESAPIDFLKRPDGSYFERPYDATTGSPIASVLFYIIWFGNFYTNNPAAQAYIDGLPVQAGYDTL